MVTVCARVKVPYGAVAREGFRRALRTSRGRVLKLAWVAGHHDRLTLAASRFKDVHNGRTKRVDGADSEGALAHLHADT